jgi:putative transposase
MYLKQRKLNRKKDFNYSQDGCYFVTIVVKGRENYFGKFVNNEIILNKYGEIINNQWVWLHNQYKYLNLDEFIVMPNHVHGIININSGHVGTGRDLSLHDQHIKIKPLSELIGAFKTTSSKLIHINGLNVFSWQRSFHDHIIRTEREYLNIKNYIQNNPMNWENDKLDL